MQPLLRRDVSGTASGRSHRYVVTQFRAHRQGGKKHQNPGCNPEKRTFRFVKYLSIREVPLETWNLWPSDLAIQTETRM